MKRALFGIVFAVFLSGCAGTVVIPVPHPSASSGTHVWEMRGMGPGIWSEGMNEIGAQEAQIPGVTQVTLFDYSQTQAIADAINADPPNVREVIEGYSCGANASPVVGAGVTRHVDAIAVIQASEWCGGTYLTPNVGYVQETYNPYFIETFGLGAYQLQPGPNFNPNNVTYIVRPDCHPCADVDPDAQADLVAATRRVAGNSLGAVMHLKRRVPGATNVLVRYHGQKPY